MITRRDYHKLALSAGVTLALGPRLVRAGDTRLEPITRAIPSTGERLPVVGLGSSATFAQLARSDDTTALREVFTALHKHGGTVFDTSPTYGVSEEIAAGLVRELGLAESLFWATKLNVVGRDGSAADPEAAKAQLEASFRHIGKDPLDLVQVHNVTDPDVQLGLLKSYKANGRIRYIGITNSMPGRYGDLESLMRSEPLDFIGIDYAIDNRAMEERILPLALDRGIGVLVYLPFGRTRLWEKVRSRELPEWAAEFDAHSWAQFFLKFVISHPAVTTATPATSKAKHMIDNMGAALGRLPDGAMRKRMIAYVENL